jgi:hypothetical protein
METLMFRFRIKNEMANGYRPSHNKKREFGGKTEKTFQL